MSVRRRSLAHRVTSILLSWVFTATTFWSMAPPAARAEPLPRGPLPARIAGFPENLGHGDDEQGKPGGHREGDERDDEDRDGEGRDGQDRDSRNRDDKDRGHEGDGHCTAPVHPVLECVEEEGPNRFTAHFGYSSENTVAVTIPVGEGNGFGHSSRDRGQPKTFQPGRTSRYPDSAFRVRFDGEPLVWTLKGPDGKHRSQTASRHSRRCEGPPPPPVPSCDSTFFGPRRYTRTKGAPDVFEEVITVPAGVTSPYVLRVQNGDADGRNRVSSATILINGMQVLRPSDLNQHVAGLSRVVVLTSPTSALRVKLASSPGSYLTLNLCGTSGDSTPPRIAWTEPAPLTNDPTPRLAVAYEDVAGSGEPAASGVDPTTLKVLVDGVDRTGVFTARAADASGEPVEALAEGPHKLEAEISDRAGNVGKSTALDFRVDLTRPTASWAEPGEGSAWRSDTVAARVEYADETALDPDSLKVTLHGTDRTALFTRGASEATGTLDDAAGLKPGPNPLVATVKDRAGNESLAASRGFFVDRQAPVVEIAQPVPPGRVGTATPEIVVRYKDDQELALGSFEAFLDGEGLSPRPLPLALTVGPDGARGQTPPLPDGSYTLVARIDDRAKNQGEAKGEVRVDTSVPDVRVVLPAPGSRTREGSPLVRVEYEDTDGLDLDTLRVRIDGADVTTLFLPAGASAAEARVAFSDGLHQVVATIQDLTGNPGTGQSDFTVDTTPPEATIELPKETTNTLALRATYSDATSGVLPTTVKAWVDGSPVAGLLAGESEATAVLATDPPLADGPHEIRLELQDRATNPRTVTKEFLLDTRPPTVEVQAPVPQGFTNDKTPEVRVGYDDPQGSGVDPGSVRVFLRKVVDPPEPEVELLAVQAGANGASVVVSEAMALADGTYRVRVSLADKAGNPWTAEASFTVDTVAPKYRFETPTKEQWLGTRTPAFSVQFVEEASGVDPARFGFAVDDKELGARFTVGATSATGALLDEDALAEGTHLAKLVVFDRAGNAGVTTDPVPFPFGVDVTPPMLTVRLPVPGSYVGVPADRVRLEYDDGTGSGIATESVEVKIDGTEPSREGWTVTASSTEGPLVPPVGDGVHALVAKVRDGAGNETTVPASFTVDTQPPVVTLDTPADGSYHKASPVTLTGTVVDADPQVTVRCRREGAEAVATVSAGSFTCALPLAEEANEVRAEASDRLAHTGESEPRTLHLDTIAPKVTIDDPQDQSWTNGEPVTVSGHVEDASPILEVKVGEAAAALTQTSTGATFTATGVSVATGTITARARDAADNPGEATIELKVDRKAPEVWIETPLADAWVRGPQVEVTGGVKDAEGSPVLVYVNESMEQDPTPAPERAFHAFVSAGEGSLDLVATARDKADNASDPKHRTVNVDFTKPVIKLDEPKDPPITNATSLHVEGTVSDISPTTLKVDGTPVSVEAGGGFSAEIPLGGEGVQAIDFVATDSVGLVGTLEPALSVVVDRTAPVVTIATPGEGDFVLNLPVVVEGTVADEPSGLPVPPPKVWVDGQLATVIGQVWSITFDSLPDGPHTFTAVARDAAGNVSGLAERNIVLDLVPPTVLITDPPEPVVTRFEAITVRGTATGRAPLSVTVNGVAATVAGGTWEAQVPLAEGDNTVTATAKSASGRPSDPDSVLVTRDSIPPTVDLQTPESIGRDEPGTGRVDAADNLPGVVAEVRIDGVPVGPPAPTPYEFAIAASPQAVEAGKVVVTAQATDKAGHKSEVVTRNVHIRAGVVVGQVLSDETGLPLAEATVTLETPAGPKTALTDEHGGYSFPAGGAVARLRVDKAGMTSAEREVTVASGVGTAVVDGRLTPLAKAVSVGPDAVALPKVELPGAIALELVLSVAAGTVSQATELRLTPLSAQGLPGLLPLGWSPVAAFDVRADGPVGPGLEAAVTGLPAGPLDLVRFDTDARAWKLEQAELSPTDGALAVSLPETGAWALVTPDDDPAPAVPAVHELLEGVAQADLPVTAVGQAAVTPSVVPPAGGEATGRLFVQSPVPLPSGTVVQAKVTEEFELTSGKKASEEVRRQDILLFRAPLPADAPAAETGVTVLHAALPVAPSRTFETAELVQGKVHLDVLSGRESVRGKTGGNRAVTVESGGAILSVPASSLEEDTAVSIEKTELSSFLPTGEDAAPLAEVVLDFAGAVLGTSAGLSVEGAAEAGETVLVARVERVLGIPRLLVVALAEANGGRITAVPAPGLPGIKAGGRYVFYELSGPVGWVSGLTLASTGEAVSGAVVEGGSLPFIGRTGAGVPYLLPVRPGAAQLSATVPGQRLVGSGSVTVAAGGPGEAASLPIALTGEATLATVTPANGTLGVAVSVQVELEATGPLDPDPVNLAKAKLSKGAVPVAVKYLLSGSGKRLAVIPLKPLDTSTEYTFTAAGIEDADGKPVLVSGVTFKTKDFVAPVYDIEKLVFSFPDPQGWVTLTAPADTLPPFSTILVMNAMNGFVGTYMAEGDGSVGHALEARLLATINDRLFVTITDPQGNVTSFERSKFVKPDGTVAIGPGGGTVEGPGGVELRLPPGAVEQGVRLKIALATEEEIAQAFTEEQLQKMLPGTTLGSVLKVESLDQPTFKKEVDLVFPVPDFTKSGGPQPAKPQDAYYYVHKKVESKDASGSPIVLFQVVDEAAVEGEGEKARIVTASPPFPGLEGPLGGLTSMLLLSWSFDVQNPGTPLPGRIVGKVLRQVWDEDAATPAYEPLPCEPPGSGPCGAKVSATDASGQPLTLQDGGTFTRSDGTDGTYALWDTRYTGGTITVVAESGGVKREAVAFESLGTDRYKPYPHDARANITFPAVKPPPTPSVLEVKAFRVEDGQRKAVDGITVVKTPIYFGIVNNSPRSIPQITVGEVGGETRAIQGPLTGDSWGLQFKTDQEYAPPDPGTYTFRTTALRADGPEIPLSWTFRAIAEEGGIETDEKSPPKVITARTVPKADAKGVPVSTFLQVAFTEPVRNIPGNVTLEDAAGEPVPVQISGVRPDLTVVDPLTSPEDVVTSLTIQPLTALRYSTKYTLKLRSGIADLDKPAAKELQPAEVQCSSDCPAPPEYPYTTSFTTFGPDTLTTPGEGETFASPGMAVMQGRAYLVRNNFMNGTLVGFNVEDPVTPVKLAGEGFFAPRPVDIAGMAEDAVSKGRLVVVATGSTNTLKPASLLLFDVTNDNQFDWIGVSSVVSSGMEGFIARVAVKGGYAYTATMKKGIQVVDLQEAVGALGTQYFDAQWAINSEGRGWGQQAVVNTIAVPKNAGRDWWLNDIDVADMGGRTLAVVTGEMGIAVADTGIGSFLFPGSWPGEIASANGQATLGFSYVSALGRLSDKDVAVVVGLVNAPEGAQFGLAVVDLADPATPALLGWVKLETGGFGPTDVILNGDTALVGMQGGQGGQTLVVSLASLTQPRLIGTIANIGGRLAIGDNGILYGSAYSPFGGNSPLGGVRSAALGYVAIIRSITPSGVVYRESQPVTEKPMIIEGDVVPVGYELQSAEIEIYRNGQLLETLPASVAGTSFTAVWPAGQPIDVRAGYAARAVVNRGGPDRLDSALKEMPVVRFVLVDKAGQEAELPMLSYPQPVVTLDPMTAAKVTLVNGGTQAQVQLSGSVTDPLADIVADGAADIKAITVGDQTIPVTRIAQTGTLLRPYAFKGQFKGSVTVDVGGGENALSVAATNLIGRTGAATVSISVAQDVTVPETLPDWSAEAPKFAKPFTLVAEPTTDAAVDAITLIHETLDPEGVTERLTETQPTSLVFAGETSDLGPARLELAAPIPPGEPGQRRTVVGTLDSLGLGIVRQPLEFVETGSATGVFRSVVTSFPAGVLQIAFDRMPSPGVLDRLKVKVGFDPTRAPEVLTETAEDSNSFTGSADGLGTAQVDILELSTGSPGEAARLRVLLASQELGLDGYVLDLREVEPLTFRSSYVFVPSGPERLPTPASTVVTGVSVEQGMESGSFDPYWIVAKGLTSFASGDVGDLNGHPVDLSLAPLPPGPRSWRGSYVHHAIPMAFVPLADSSTLGVAKTATPRVAETTLPPNVVAAPVPSPAASPTEETRAAMAQAGATKDGERFRAGLGRPNSNRRAAIIGTTSQVVIWVKDPQPTKVTILAEDGNPATDLAVERAPQPDGSEQGPNGETLHRMRFPLRVNADAKQGWRGAKIEFPDGSSKKVDKQIFITHRRLIVLAVDGFGWDPFVNVRDEAPNLQKLFGTNLDLAQGQSVLRQVLTTFTPITFGRWASLFSGALPRQIGVPSNEYMNRKGLLYGTETWGEVSQCLGCGSFAHLTYTLPGGLGKEGAYNRHFQVPFIYDRLHEQAPPPSGGPAPRRHSVVFGQQAGLGQLNTKGKEKGLDTWKPLSASLLADGVVAKLLHHGFGAGKAYDSAMKDMALNELQKQPLTNGSADFDIMTIYLGGHDEDLHQGHVRQDPNDQSPNDASQYDPDKIAARPSEEYVKRTLDPMIGEVMRAADAALMGSAIFAFTTDHAHVRLDPRKQMDLDFIGTSVRIGDNGRLRWLDVLAPKGMAAAEEYRVSKTMLMAGDPTRPANVVFVPMGGMAHVFVAADPAGGALAWKKAPSLERLRPLIDNVRSLTAQWPKEAAAECPVKEKCRAINDVLVRMPGPIGEQEGQNGYNQSEYRVLSREYMPPTCGPNHDQTCNVCGTAKTSPCVLENELLPLDKMEAEPFAPASNDAFKYANPAGRVADWISENSGDIILLPNMEQEYFFDKDALWSTHGSLFEADARVPLGFSYPGATSPLRTEDNVLDGVREFLRNEQPKDGLDMPIERRAMESALGLEPCKNSDVGGCATLPPP
jgi:hypothetical protein